MKEPTGLALRRRLPNWNSYIAMALAATMWLLPTPAASQALYGGLTGTIADGSGAAVPGATVTIKNEDTGLELTAVTDETGTYTIRNVAGGTYTLKASLQGFKEFVQTGIPVVVGNIVRINGRLEIGALTESVTVTTRSDAAQDGQGRRQRRPAGRRTSSTCR